MKKVLLLALVLLGVLVSSSLTAQEKQWSLFGTWVNTDYDKSGDFSGKVSYGNDSQVSLFHLTSDSARYGYAPYVIEKDWIESGIHWFRVKLMFPEGTYYEIDKLTKGGDTYESVFTTGTYPTSFDTSGKVYSYTIRTRQR